MHVDQIRAYALRFPGATENLQWGDDLRFKVGGKIFLTLGLDTHRLCLKCTLEAFAELIERENIRPAPYVGRYKWVMLDRLDALRVDELEEFVRQSYEMVAANGPKSRIKIAAKTKRSRSGRSGTRKGTPKAKKSKNRT